VLSWKSEGDWLVAPTIRRGLSMNTIAALGCGDPGMAPRIWQGVLGSLYRRHQAIVGANTRFAPTK